MSVPTREPDRVNDIPSEKLVAVRSIAPVVRAASRLDFEVPGEASDRVHGAER